jgi:uncharacterized repeat protein (TIGR03806 family)
VISLRVSRIGLLSLSAGLCAALNVSACSSDAPSPSGTGGSGNSGGTPANGGGGASTTAGVSGTGNTAGTALGGSGGAAGGGLGGVAGNGGAAGGAAVGCVLPPSGEEPATLLSATGCVNMAEPSKPAPGLLPYAVRSPLWSDAADKHRFLRVPDGSKIQVLDCSTRAADCVADSGGGEDGHWEFPPGTAFVKNFAIEGKLIETRLIFRRSMTRWQFYGYEWNDAGTEATLLPDDTDGKDKPVGTASQVWHYPGRQQCPQCHTAGAGFSLGPSTPQLNSDFAYPDGSMNQIEKFKQLGLFDAPPPTLAGYPDPAGTDALEKRAQSYLEANCAICHRPAGEYAALDLRWGVAFDKTGLCLPIDRDMENPALPKMRLVPGDPSKSAISFRMHSLEKTRMPKIGSNVVDAAGTKLIDDWITAMPTTACGAQP